MPKYKFKAKNNDGKIMKGVFTADDENDLREIISGQNYFLISFKKISESSNLFSFLEKVKLNDLTLFLREFAIMISAGFTIIKSVEMLKRNTANKKLKEILEVVYEDLLKGKMLSDSFKKYPKTFPVFFINMIYIGEVSGKLDIILPKLADYYDNQMRIKRKVKSALSYPIFLVGMAFVVIVALSLYIIPIFAELFKSFDTELPVITKISMMVSSFIQNYFLFIFLGILFLILLFVIFKKTRNGKVFFDNLKIKMPIVKGLTIARLTTEFASGFSTLLSSSVSIVESIDIMSGLLGNIEVERRFIIALKELKRGVGISKSIATINLFPNMLIEMLHIGEETSEIENILNRTSGYFDEELNRAIRKMTSLIEPVLIIVVGFIVLFVILSVFMPMLDLMSSIEGIGG